MLKDDTDVFMRFRQRLDEKKRVYGLAVTLPEIAVAEIAANAGFDYAWIEMEHTTLTLSDVEKLIVALENRRCIPLVRVPRNEANIIGQVLDLGARIVNIPHVDTVDDARRAIHAAKYYPVGRRGYASMTRNTNQGLYRIDIDRMREKNENTMLMVQIESVEAVKNAEGIAALDGVDALFIGYADLCQDMGCAPDPHYPDCAKAIRAVGEALLKTGKYGMFIISDPAELDYYHDLGFDMILCGMDSRILKAGAETLRERFGRGE